MVERSPEKMIEVLDAAVDHIYIAAIARAVHIDKTTIFRWLAASEKQPRAWAIKWGDRGRCAFHEAFKEAQLLGKVALAYDPGEIEASGPQTQSVLGPEAPELPDMGKPRGAPSDLDGDEIFEADEAVTVTSPEPEPVKPAARAAWSSPDPAAAAARAAAMVAKGPQLHPEPEAVIEVAAPKAAPAPSAS